MWVLTIEALDGTIQWNSIEKKVSVFIEGKTIEFWINQKTAKVDDESFELDVEPQVINGRTMMPIRFLAEKIGLNVTWNDNLKEITLTK